MTLDRPDHDPEKDENAEPDRKSHPRIIGLNLRRKVSDSVSAGADKSTQIRVLTVNAHQGFGAFRRTALLARMREALRHAGADVVFLQEIGVAAGSAEPLSQFELLADTVWPQHAYGRNAVSAGGHHGNALLSKYPIAKWQNVDASVGHAEPRGLLYCVLHVSNPPTALHAVCVHFGLIESHRRRQLGRLVELVNDAIPAPEPIVIAGDFNDWRESAHRRLTSELRLEEVHAGPRGRPRRSFPARFPCLRLDRIYVRNLGYRSIDVPRRPWARLTDHIPLSAELSVPHPTNLTLWRRLSGS
jgi:endonuclease/exonuclease/phosphatase family metal-dependent hydrolase